MYMMLSGSDFKYLNKIKHLRISMLLYMFQFLPLACDVPRLTYFSADNNRPGSDLQIHCTAFGTPAPSLSVVDERGSTLYVSDVPGSLDYTIYNGGCSGSTEYYTCWADNGERSSSKIMYNGKCPKDSSYLSPFASFCVANGTIFALIIVFILGCHCKRRISRECRRPPENAGEMGPNGRSQMTEATHQSYGPSRPIALVGTLPNLTHLSVSNDALISEDRARPQRLTSNWKFPSGPFLCSMPDGNRGSISRIHASSTSMHNSSTTSEQSGSQTMHRPELHASCVHTSVVPPLYDLTFTPSPEYTQIPSRRATPGLHDDRPPKYADVMTQQGTAAVHDDRPPEYNQILTQQETPVMHDERPPEYADVLTKQETAVMHDDRPPEYSQISTGQATLVLHDDQPPINIP